MNQKEVLDWEEAEKRMNVVGQNGNDGSHYDELLTMEVSDSALLNSDCGVKHDFGKPQFRLIPQEALESLARVMSYGANKYAPDNWRKVDSGHDRYMDAALRHINAHLRGEVLDDESNLPHLMHAVASLMMAYESK